MATSNKAQDPAAAALLAIEEALNLAAAGDSPKAPELSTPVFPKASDPDKTPKLMRRQGEDAKAPPVESADRFPPRLPEVDEHQLFSSNRVDRRAERRPASDAQNLPPLTAEHGDPLSPSARPANDDRHSIGPILRALNKRPSRAPQILAIAFSAFWLVLVSAYFYTNRGSVSNAGGFFTRPETALYALLAFGPVLFFVITAILIRRAQEMRLTARSLAEIAMRLAEPETVATEQVVTLSQAIRREIVSMGDGIERALARAGELETLVRSEVSNLERSYSDNERRIKALVDGLSSERENMLHNAERMRNAITSVQETFAHDIDAASARLADGLGEAANRVTTSLGAKGEEIRFALGRTGDELVSNLLLRGEDIIGRLEQTQQNIGYALAETGDAVTQGLAVRLGEIDAHLRGTSEAAAASVAGTIGEAVSAIAMHGDRVNEALADRMSRFEEAVLGPGNQVAERVAAETEQMGVMLAGHFEAIETTLGRCGSELGLRSHQAAEALEAQLTAFDERTAVKTLEVEQSLDTLLARLDSGLGHCGNELELRSQQATASLEAQLQIFEERAAAKTFEVEQSLDGILSRLESGFGQHGNDLELRSQQTTDAMEAQLSSFEERTTNKAQEVKHSLDGLLGRIHEGLDGRAASLNETLAAHTLELARVLSDGGRDVTQALETRIGEVEEIFVSRSTSLTDTLSAKAKELNLALGGRALEIAETFSTRADEVDQVLGARASEINEAFSRRAAEANVVLGARALEINEAFSARTGEINEVLGARALEIAETLDSRITRFEEQVVGRLDMISGDLDSRGHNVAESLIACAMEIDSTLREHAATIGQVLDHESGQLSAVMNGRVEALRDLLSQASNDLDTTLAGRTGEIGSVLAERVNEIGGALAHRLAEVQTTLDERSNALRTGLNGCLADVRSLLDEKGGGLIELLSARGGEITQQMTSVGEFVTHVLESRGASIVEELGLKQRELTSAIDQSSTNLRTAVQSSAATSVNALVETNEKLSTDIAATLGQLDERNLALQGLIDSAGTNLNAVETALAGEIGDFRETISGITKEIQSLGANADTTLASASALYENIARQQQALSAAAEELVRSQAELDRSLDERRMSLDGLLNVVQERREDFGSVMNTFSASIEEAFERVEGRARDIGAFLAEASQATTGLVERQFGEIRTAMGSERAHTASLLRAAYDQANTEIETIFSQSTERFQSAATEMRGLAREIQRELETTREELHRNAVSLPQETAEQAAVMRRVVADQIKALNELTDVVARSGRAYDISDPMTPGAAARIVDTGSTVRRIEPSRGEQTRFVEPPRPEPPRPNAVVPPPRPATPLPAPERNGAGWLSDLLARASRDDGPQPGRASAVPASRVSQQSEAIETISHDIARMVDHSAVAEAWEHYRRGDVNAFTRQLYIGRGPQTFDDIRRRYKSDPDFRTTVDRYIQEFERLLADVNRDDRDDSLTRTYLTSETGKVYTMLAHAGGRLG